MGGCFKKFDLDLDYESSMPFGLSNAFLTFHCYIEHVFIGMYVEDVCIAPDTKLFNKILLEMPFLYKSSGSSLAAQTFDFIINKST